MYIKEENGKKIVNYQIFKQDNKGRNGESRFMEIVDSMFYNKNASSNLKEPKFIFNFCSYSDNGQKGNKMKASIPIYVSIKEAMQISKSFLNISLLERIYKRNMQKGKKYMFQIQGGTSPEHLKQQNRTRKDGKAESRILVIEPGKSAPFIMTAKIGAGIVDNSHNGIIIPNGKTERYIMVSFQYEDIIVLANELEIKINSFRNRQECSFLRNLGNYLKTTK